MIQGKAITFGNNIDTDQIIGAHHLSLPSIAEMAPYAFEHHANFVTHFVSGDIIVGGDNFGCGSSREQAPAVLRKRGVAAVVARGFARIFFRNAVNLGLPVIVCPEAGEIEELAQLLIAGNRLRNRTTGREHGVTPLPSFIQDLIGDGGIIAHLRRKEQGGAK